MKRWLKITTGLAGLSAVAGAGLLGLRRARMKRAWRETEAALLRLSAEATFDPRLLDGLPAPAQRYLRHAIAEGAPLAQSVQIQMKGRMKPSADADFIDLTAEELLGPPAGFQWTARFNAGPVPVWVRDHYYRNAGAVSIEPLGLPLKQSTGANIARSSRHRLAAEAVWLPTSLLPGPAVQWQGLDDHRARVAMTIDGEAIPLTLTIDDAGRLQQVIMRRHGNEGVPTWQRIPYGFAVEADATFGAYTVPSRLRGGWWFGTERYAANQASSFQIETMTFH